MLKSTLLSSEEILWCKTKVGHNNQIAFGLMLTYFRTFYRFPAVGDNLLPLLSCLIEELKLSNLVFCGFDWKSRTAEQQKDIEKK